MPTCKPPGQIRDYGDVTGNGSITMTDLTNVANHINGTVPLTGDKFIRADVDGDGVVTQNDLELIGAYISDPNTVFPVCAAAGGDVVDDTLAFSVSAIAAPAKGRIDSIDAPPSAAHNEYITVRSTIRNVGTSTGTFKIRVAGVESTTRSITTGSTYTFAIQVQMPSTGTSATFTLECVRIT
jgi:hypothetical protein